MRFVGILEERLRKRATLVLASNVIERETQRTVDLPKVSRGSFPLVSTVSIISSRTVDSRSNCITCTGLTPDFAGSVAGLSRGLLVSVSPPAGTTRDCMLTRFDIVRKDKMRFPVLVQQQKVDQWVDQCIVCRAVSPTWRDKRAGEGWLY